MMNNDSALQLSNVLNQECTRSAVHCQSKKRALEIISELAAKQLGLPPQVVFEAILTREKMGSTGIGNGIAIPHGKAKAVDHLIAACGVSRTGIDFDAVDKQPATLFILLVSPENVGGPHVKVLANISRLLKEDKVRDALRASESPVAFVQVLRDAEAKYL